MKKLALVTAVGAGLALSGCASAPVEMTTRGAQSPLSEQQIVPATLPVEVVSVDVDVPRSLKVSEANRFLPGGDIVWRGDPPGDRYKQVQAIFETAMREGADAIEGDGVPVTLDIEVTRFHALTEKARYTVGGVHAIQFNMQLRDPETGAPLGEPHFVKADFRALGGQAAVRAEQAGLTQKKRITEHLAKVIRTELTSPEGYHGANLGLIGLLNQI